MRLTDKVCVVTGGASGIGRATAVAFAAEGALTVVADSNVAGGEETVAQLNGQGAEAIFVECDVASEASCGNVVATAQATFGGLDVLFNNAGINPLEGDVVGLSLDTWRRVFAVNVDSILYCSRHAIPLMKRRGGGRIINTASPASFKGWKDNAAYIASKGAVMSLTRAMAMDCIGANIRVNALVPGLIMTGIGRDFISAQADPEATAAGNPAGRPGQPEEVASIVVYLASGECSFTTGAPFFVDGGELAGSA